jgi:hypothetical protein
MYNLRYSFSSSAGLTIAAKLLNDSGSITGPATVLSSFGSNGSYGFTIRHSTQFMGFLGFYNTSNDSLVALFAVNPQEAENLDIPSSQVGSPTSGGSLFTYTVTNYVGAPVSGVAVWITNDAAGLEVAAGTFYSDVNGNIECTLPPGDFYLWRRHPGWNFRNPKAITVS